VQIVAQAPRRGEKEATVYSKDRDGREVEGGVRPAFVMGQVARAYGHKSRWTLSVTLRQRTMFVKNQVVILLDIHKFYGFVGDVFGADLELLDEFPRRT